MSDRANTKQQTLASLAWPIFVEQGFRVLLGTIDTVMVSHVSDGAVAAVGVAHQIVIFAVLLFSVMGVGSSVVITHHLGAGDRGGADRIARAAIGVNTWIGLAMSVVVAVTAEHSLRLLQLPDPLVAYARPFLVVMGGTLFLEAQNVAMAATLRAHGHTRDVMAVSAMQNVLNAFCNAVLLFGLFGAPELGVTGVAISGVLSRMATWVVARQLVLRRTGVRLSVADYFALSLDALRRISRIGLPSAADNMSNWLALMTITSLASRMGETSLAAFAYSRQLTLWVVLAATSIGLATEIRVGQRVGAGDVTGAREEVSRNSRAGVLCAFGASTLLALTAPYLLLGVTSNGAVIGAATQLQRLGPLLESARVFNLVSVNALRASGDTRFSVILNAMLTWIVRVPMAWLLGLQLGWGLVGLGIAMVGEEWLRGLCNYLRWNGRSWLKHAERVRADVRETTLKPARLRPY